jgi:hypothetical protein
MVSNLEETADSRLILLSRLQKFSFAKQWLHQQNYKILKGNQEILKFDGNPLYDIIPIETSIAIKENVSDSGKIKKIMHYADLKKEGYIIVSKRLMSPWPSGIRNQYLIIPKHLGGHDLNQIPQNNSVEFDVSTKRFRLIGPNANIDGIGHWTKPKTSTIYDNGTQEEKKINFSYYKNNFNKIMMRARGIEVEDTEFLPVKEIPLIFSEAGELICLPESADENVIGVVGERGKGKTFTVNSIASRIYWKRHDNIAYINDRYKQTQQLSIPLQAENFIEQIRRVGEHPMPLPMVWLYPTTNTTNEARMFARDAGLSHLVSFPFNQAVDDYENFFRGKKEWDLGATAPLLRLISEELHTARTMEDIYKVINEAEIDKEIEGKYNIPNGSKAKVLRVLNDVYTQQMLDISTQVPSKWKIIDRKTGDSREYSPITACMACKLVPSLITSSLFTKHYYPQYLKYILDDIFNAQTSDDYFYNNKIVTYLIVDEITNIASTTNKSVAQESLVTCVTEGRPNRIGFVYTTQNYSVIDRRIRENTTHLLAFKLKKEAKVVKSDFSLSDTEEEELKNLQKFELLAMTTDKYIVYDNKGGRRESEPGEIFKGFIIPPLCEPSPPR